MGVRAFLAMNLALCAVTFCGTVFAQVSDVLVSECKRPDGALLGIERQQHYWESAKYQADLIADNGKGAKSAIEWWAERFSLEGFGQIAGERKWIAYDDGLSYVDKNHVAVKLAIPFDVVHQLRRESSARRALAESSALAEMRARSDFFKKFIDLRAALAGAKQIEADKFALDIAALSKNFRDACLTAPWQEAMRGSERLP